MNDNIPVVKKQQSHSKNCLTSSRSNSHSRSNSLECRFNYSSISQPPPPTISIVPPLLPLPSTRRNFIFSHPPPPATSIVPPLLSSPPTRQNFNLSQNFPPPPTHAEEQLKSRRYIVLTGSPASAFISFDNYSQSILEVKSSTKLSSPNSHPIHTDKPNLRTPIISKLTPPPPPTRLNSLILQPPPSTTSLNHLNCPTVASTSLNHSKFHNFATTSLNPRSRNSVVTRRWFHRPYRRSFCISVTVTT